MPAFVTFPEYPSRYRPRLRLLRMFFPHSTLYQESMTQAAYPVFFTAPVRVLLAATVLTAAIPALGQVVAPEQLAAEAAPKLSQWGLGMGVGFDKRPLRDFDNELKPLPLVLYESQRLSVFGARIDYKLPSYGPLSFRLRARYANDGYEADDSPYLTGMEERKGGYVVGRRCHLAQWRVQRGRRSGQRHRRR